VLGAIREMLIDDQQMLVAECKFSRFGDTLLPDKNAETVYRSVWRPLVG
jgi:hypothetical protein